VKFTCRQVSMADVLLWALCAESAEGDPVSISRLRCHPVPMTRPELCVGTAGSMRRGKRVRRLRWCTGEAMAEGEDCTHIHSGDS